MFEDARVESSIDEAGEVPVHAAAMATWDDVEKIAATIKDPGYSLYIRVMAYTGLRPGEVRVTTGR